MKTISAPSLLLFCVAACAQVAPEPPDAIDHFGPVTQRDAKEQSSPAVQHFKLAYEVAQYDAEKIASATAAPGKRYPEHLPQIDTEPVDGKKRIRIKVDDEKLGEYSPLHVCTYSDLEINGLKKDIKDKKDQLKIANTEFRSASNGVASVAAKFAAGTTTTSNELTDAQSKLTSAQNKAAQAEQALAKVTSQLDAARRTTTTGAGAPKPGCSYQSMHARSMAYYGFALIDQNCEDFFRQLINLQTNLGVASNTIDSFGGLAGIAGLVGGGVVAPSAVTLLTSGVKNITTVTRQNILMDQSDIALVYQKVRQALAADTAGALPEPDNSDWTFNLALARIRTHQNLCRRNQIQALIRESAAAGNFQAKPAAAESAGKNTDTGATRNASGEQIIVPTR